jgi:hypothetical protein
MAISIGAYVLWGQGAADAVGKSERGSEGESESSFAGGGDAGGCGSNTRNSGALFLSTDWGCTGACHSAACTIARSSADEI